MRRQHNVSTQMIPNCHVTNQGGGRVPSGCRTCWRRKCKWMVYECFFRKICFFWYLQTIPAIKEGFLRWHTRLALRVMIADLKLCCIKCGRSFRNLGLICKIWSQKVILQSSKYNKIATLGCLKVWESILANLDAPWHWFSLTRSGSPHP